ncbi:hypothetical protein HX096_05875 [Empedobacter falsenii]|uniref:hypothetical protein n=1 Tax=Empedobacter falsenii TaxID=343874 RepID=UPI0025768FFA|nr:hypothetical protein [Empedobacter falsenii]MDM1547388.1 hypothetical protein [Empedobacter falsenii]
MEKLLINGKFKKDFTKWLNEASLNYNTSFDDVLTFGTHEQIDFLMKFLNGKPYGPSYKSNEHEVFDTFKMNKLIQEYNEKFIINENLLFHYHFNYNGLDIFYNQHDVDFEVRNSEGKNSFDVYYKNNFIKKITLFDELNDIFIEKTGKNLEDLT